MPNVIFRRRTNSVCSLANGKWLRNIRASRKFMPSIKVDDLLDHEVTRSFN